MAYSQFVATDRQDILDGLETFCVTTLGMTLESSSTGYITLSGANFSEYATFYSSLTGASSELVVDRHSALTGTVPSDYDNRGVPGRTNLLSEGPYPNVFCFGKNTATEAYVHVVVEIADGYYRHFGFGEISKFGTWTGGAYCYGHNHNQTTTFIDNFSAQNHAHPFAASNASKALGGGIRLTSSDGAAHGVSGADADFGPWYVSRLAATTIGAGCGMIPRSNMCLTDGFGMMMSGYHSVNPVAYNNQIILGDPTFFAGVDGGLRPIGKVLDIRWCSLTGVSPKEEITIASDTWKLFPICRKFDPSGDSNLEGSYDFGMAYLK